MQNRIFFSSAFVVPPFGAFLCVWKWTLARFCFTICIPIVFFLSVCIFIRRQTLQLTHHKCSQERSEEKNTFRLTVYKNELITLIIIRSLKLIWTSATSRQPPHNMHIWIKRVPKATHYCQQNTIRKHKKNKNLLTKLMLMRRQPFVYSTEYIEQSLAECNWPKFYSIFSFLLLLLSLFWFLNDSVIRWTLNRFG